MQISVNTMSFLHKIKNKIHYTFLKWVKPEIIGQHNDIQISNLSHISNQNDHLKLGKSVFIGHYNYIDAFNAPITIGDFVQIGNYCSILSHSTHHAIRLAQKGQDRAKLKDLYKIAPVSIGAYTYIGPHSIIMPGTKIGVGCIISSYSYVNGDIPDYAIVRGQPAKIIGDTRTIDKKLLEEYPELHENYYRNENHI